MRLHASTIGLILALLCASTAPASDIYKWVDAEGNVHYGDRPLGDNPEILDIESRPTDPARVQAMATARSVQRAESEEAEAAEAAEQPTAEEKRAQAAERATQCAAAQLELETYMNNRRLYRQTADGEREYLSDAEITATRENAVRKVDEFCS
jgi:hypothetical protein